MLDRIDIALCVGVVFAAFLVSRVLGLSPLPTLLFLLGAAAVQIVCLLSVGASSLTRSAAEEPSSLDGGQG